jgi:predicted outer membrane repeat protein
MQNYPYNKWLLILGIILGNLTIGNTQIIYVQQGATGNGTSWSNATGNLKSAIDNATSGTQIWVAEGIYYPITCSPCIFEDRQVSFILTDNVKLYGGFTGNESNISERDITENPTILSGNIDQDDTPWSNTYSIIRTQNVTEETVIDGFIIEDGTADFSNAAAGDPYNSGAAWYNNGSLSNYFAHPVARNCTFRNHYAAGLGAAIYNDGGFGGSCNPLFENCTFENCTGELGGGAIYNNAIFGGDCSPTFAECSFLNNHSPLASGGAVNNEGAEGGISNPTFNNCFFFNNTASTSGGAVYNFGKNGTCNSTFNNCQFDGNQAQGGGAIYSDGTFMGEANGIYTSCSFTNNSCTNGNGGAIYNNGIGNGLSNPIYQNCTFGQNESAAAGGVVFNNGSGGTASPSFFNCIFSENLANEIAGVMYNLGTAEGNSSPLISNCLIYRNTAYVSAAAIYNLGSENGNASPTITNCTFFGNSAPLSGAVYNNANDANGTANAVMTNCVFWANNADLGKVLRNIWSNPTISHCIVDVADCNELNSGNDANLMCGAGMLYNQNPLFVDTSANNFRLLMNSPAINSGNNAAAMGIGVDLDGLPRMEGVVDMGAYEFGSSAGTAPVITMNPQSQTTCTGESVTLSVTANSSQPLSYQWQKNNINIPDAMSENYTISSVAPSNAGSYNCVVTNSLNEMATSQDAVLTVNQTQDVEVEILATATEICAGENVTLSAQPTNAGLTPTYQWQLNGNDFGGSIESFSIDALQDGDVITLIFTSSADCVTNPVVMSNSLTFSVGTAFEVEVELMAESTSFCENTPAIFNAIPTNEGMNPAYVWYVNSIAQSVDAPQFMTNTLNDGDVVQVQMTSSKDCVVTSTVLSETTTVNVLPSIFPELAIDAPVDSVLCMDTEITFEAIAVNGGNTPTYQWHRNGIAVGTNAPTYTTDDLEDGEMVNCTLISSEECAVPNLVQSNNLEIMVDSCNVATFEIFPDSEWTVAPNPTNGEFILTINADLEDVVVQVLNMNGQIVKEEYIKNTQSGVQTKIINIRSIVNGTYFIKIQNGNIFAVKKLILAK